MQRCGGEGFPQEVLCDLRELKDNGEPPRQRGWRLEDGVGTVYLAKGTAWATLRRDTEHSSNKRRPEMAWILH